MPFDSIFQEKFTMSDENSGAPKKAAQPAQPARPQTKPTGQRRSLERGKNTRKKNPGKRARSGGS